MSIHASGHVWKYFKYEVFTILTIFPRPKVPWTETLNKDLNFCVVVFLTFRSGSKTRSHERVQKVQSERNAGRPEPSQDS